VYLVLALIVALLAAVFAVQNAIVVPLRFVGWEFEASLPLVILGSAAAGAAVVGVLSALRGIRASVRLWDAQARLRRLESELKESRARTKQLEEELAGLRARQADVREAKEDSP